MSVLGSAHLFWITVHFSRRFKKYDILPTHPHENTTTATRRPTAHMPKIHSNLGVLEPRMYT
jgi:hypothetical protein